MNRVIVTDGQGAAWVGSESGNVRRVELKRKEVAAGKAQLWLENLFTLRHHPKSRRGSTNLASVASTELDDLSRAGSARASEDFAAEEPPIAPGSKAHAGPVTAIEMHRNTVYTSGGSPGAAALHEWTQGGLLHHAHKLRELGEAPTSCSQILHHCGIAHCHLQSCQISEVLSSHAACLLWLRSSVCLAYGCRCCPLSSCFVLRTTKHATSVCNRGTMPATISQSACT